MLPIHMLLYLYFVREKAALILFTRQHILMYNHQCLPQFKLEVIGVHSVTKTIKLFQVRFLQEMLNMMTWEGTLFQAGSDSLWDYWNNIPNYFGSLPVLVISWAVERAKIMNTSQITDTTISKFLSLSLSCFCYTILVNIDCSYIIFRKPFHVVLNKKYSVIFTLFGQLIDWPNKLCHILLLALAVTKMRKLSNIYWSHVWFLNNFGLSSYTNFPCWQWLHSRTISFSRWCKDLKQVKSNSRSLICWSS